VICFSFRCDVDFKGKNPTTCTGYNASQSGTAEDLRSHLISGLTELLEDRADLAMVNDGLLDAE
jgi:hypothetical protein